MMDSTSRQILQLSRRGLLRGATGMAALAVLQAVPLRRPWAQPVFTRDPFSLGVASGDPWPDGMVLWTRLAPEPLEGGGMPDRPVPVDWQVATDPAMRTIVQQGQALARPERGHALHVEVFGLLPERSYWYRFIAGGVTSPTGRSRTTPAPGASPARLRFVNAGCQHYEQGFFTAWRHIAEEAELDFVFHYGDYIYEYGAHAGLPRRHASDEPFSLDDYRNRYAQYRLDPDLAAAHAAHPFLPSFDDHEVENDWAGEASGPRRPVPAAVFALRKQAAFRAWFEHMPLRPAQCPHGPGITAFRALRFGDLLDVAVLDTRSFRGPQPCGGGVAAPCATRDDPALPVLGAAQEDWLLRRLSGTTARWRLLAQQVPMLQRDFGTGSGPRLAMDKWDGYPAARDRLFRHVREQGIQNLVVVSGDVHSAWAGTLKLDFDRPESPAIGTEFTGTSISSGGDGSEQNGSTPRILARNPHLAFFNNRRGYTLHEVRPDRFGATFRAVEAVSHPGAPREDRGSFVVEAGRAAVLRG